jgi:hypothetical protein
MPPPFENRDITNRVNNTTQSAMARSGPVTVINMKVPNTSPADLGSLLFILYLRDLPLIHAMHE